VIAAALAALFSVVTGCSKTAPPAPDASVVAPVIPALAKDPGPLPKGFDAPLFKMLPRQAAMVVALRAFETSGQLFRAHVERRAALLGVEAKPLLEDFALGLLNPFDAAARARFGIDGRRPVAFVVDPIDRWPFVALPVSSHEAFDRATRAALGSSLRFETLASGAHTVTLVRRGDAVHLAYVHKDGYTLVAPGDDADAKTALLTLLALPPAEALVRSPTFRAAVATLPSLQDGFVFLEGLGLRRLHVERRGASITDHEKRIAKATFDAFPAAAFSLRLDPRDAHLEGRVLLGPAGKWAEVFAAPAGAFALARFVDPNAVASAKLRLDGESLWRRLLALDPSLEARLRRFGAALEKRLGVHVERDLLQNLGGHAVLELAAIDPATPAQAANPPREALRSRFDFVLAATLKDEAAMDRALAGAVSFAQEQPDAGLRLRERVYKGTKVRDLTAGGEPPLSIALLPKVLVLASSEGRLERVLDRLAVPVPPGAPQAAAPPVHVNISINFDMIRAALAPAPRRDESPRPAAGSPAESPKRRVDLRTLLEGLRRLDLEATSQAGVVSIRASLLGE
jgi:hypothetical protein